MSKKTELVVIGAGPGGYAAAFRAADLGMEVTLIDPEENPGGVCLYRGCIPSKALLHLTKIKQDAKQVADFGLEFDDPKIDVKKIRQWKEKVVKKLTGGVGQLTQGRKINYIQGKAAFKSENEVTITSEEGKKHPLTFKNAIIATGSLPTSLPNIKVDHKQIIDSADALKLKDIPKSLLVIGGGYIGLEMGSVYHHLGAEVSIAEMTDGFLPGTDRDLIKVFEEAQDFENLYFETAVEEVKLQKNNVKVNLKGKKGSSKQTFDKVLVAVGRKPNLRDLNLETANIKPDKKGFIAVNEKRQTKKNHIYAIGDLTGDPLLAHKATYEGRIATEVIAGKEGAAYDPKAIPGVVFTNPELAWCGLTETQAKEEGRKFKTVKFPWSASGRAIANGETSGLTKLLIDPETEFILGGAVAGKNAGSLIPEIVLAIEMGATAEDLSLTIHPHPTLSETLMESAELFYGSSLHVSGGN